MKKKLITDNVYKESSTFFWDCSVEEYCNYLNNKYGTDFYGDEDTLGKRSTIEPSDGCYLFSVWVKKERTW